MPMRHLVAIAIIVELLVVVTPTASADRAWWPQFRGPNAGGVAEDGTYPVEFGPEKSFLWKTALPEGHSSPCIWDDHIFLTSFDRQNEKLETLCLSRTTGEIRWRRAAPAESIEKVNKISSPCLSDPRDGWAPCLHLFRFVWSAVLRL